MVNSKTIVLLKGKSRVGKSAVGGKLEKFGGQSAAPGKAKPTADEGAGRHRRPRTPARRGGRGIPGTFYFTF